jgi:metallo-beta-lactamase class B
MCNKRRARRIVSQSNAFRIIGNIYYVGASGVSSFLIATPAGNILLDGGFVETAPQIEKNVRALGFRMRDVGYLLNSHAHYDHCGGLAELKRASGAQMVATGPDASTLVSGHQLSYGKGQSEARFPAVQVDRVIGDGEQLSLGGVKMTAHLTPGHTKGCTTWTMPVTENGKVYQVVFYCSTTVAGNQLVRNPKYPGIVADYRHSFALLKGLPCDVFLAPHPEFFHMREKLEDRAERGANPFVDPAELGRFLMESERDFNETLAKQEAPRQPPSRLPRQGHS